MFCSNCGSNIPSGNQFCISCGTKVQIQQVQPAAQPIIQQQVQPVPQPIIQQQMGQGYQQQYPGGYRRPEEYLNLNLLRIWAIALIFFSPLFGIWGYMVVGQVKKTTTEYDARRLYKKARTLCIIGTVFSVISMMLYSGM